MRRRLRQGPGADVVVVLGTFLLLGVVCGVLWWLLVDPAAFTRSARGGAAMSEIELSKRFNADGWYAVIAIVAGFLSGLGLAWWRTRDFRLTTALLVPGAALAAWVMSVVGHGLGPDSPRVALLEAHRGQSVPVELTVNCAGAPHFGALCLAPVYLMWPVAVLFGALMVLWSAPGVAEHDHAAAQWTGDEPPETSHDNHQHSVR